MALEIRIEIMEDEEDIKCYTSLTFNQVADKLTKFIHDLGISSFLLTKSKTI